VKDWVKLLYAVVFLVLAILAVQYFPRMYWTEYVKWSFVVFCVFATGHFITR